MNRKLVAMLAGLGMAAGFACSSSNNGGGGTSIITPSIDLFVYDNNFEDLPEFDDGTALIYLDVLNDPAGGEQSPDIVLDSTSTGVVQPRFPLFVGDDLYIGDRDGFIHIYRDYASLSDGATPDVTLSDDGGGANTISSITGIAFGNDTIFGLDRSSSQAYVFANASALTGDQAPDATLSTDLDSPVGIYYSADNDQLFIANNTNSSGVPCIGRYEDASALTADQAPDAFLTTDVSFDFNNGAGFCRHVFVDEATNQLFVTTDEQDHSDSQNTSAIFQFDNASGFSNDDLPVAVIQFDGVHTLAPTVMTVANDRLWVATKNSYDDDYCNPGAGVEGYSLDSDGNLLTGQDPVVYLNGGAANSLSRSQSFSVSGGFLFVQNFEGCDDFTGFGNVFVYNAQNGGPNTGDEPFMVLPSGLNFGSAVAVTAILSDFGT